jgi:uncharacterized membrane protein YGL010W
MAGLARYMAQYDHEHTSAWNRILHGVGIPLIFAGILLLILVKWKLGLTTFLAGWALLFLGHRIEGNRPAFFQGLIYLLVGPIWVAKEAWTALTGKHRASGGAPTGPRQ